MAVSYQYLKEYSAIVVTTAGVLTLDDPVPLKKWIIAFEKVLLDNTG